MASRPQDVLPENCPTPEYHETHRYCPSCRWNEDLETDMVNHPPHYTDGIPGIECIDVVEHMNFNRGNAIKYIWRAGSKGDAIEDLQKARWYINREIDRIEDSI